MKLLIPAFTLVVLAVGADALAQPPSFHPPVNLSSTPGEPSNLTHAAADGSQLIVVWREQRADGLEEIRLRRSTNHGAALAISQALVLLPEGAQVFSLRAAVSGTNVLVLYAAGVSAGEAGLNLLRSADGGASFTAATIGEAGASAGDVVLNALGEVHLVFEDVDHEIVYQRANDGGVVFSAPFNLSNSEAASRTPRISVNDQRVAVTWQEDDDVVLAHSADGGATFVPVANASASPTASSMPVVAMLDAIHLIWNEAGVVVHRHSLDGATFSPLTVLSTALPGDVVSSITISGVSNLVNAAWSTRDASAIARGPFFRRSSDGGASFGPALDLAPGAEGAHDTAIASGMPMKLAWADALSGDTAMRREIACGVSWLNPVSGMWSDATKWSSGLVPTSSDEVCLTVDGTYTVTVQNARAASSVVVGGEANGGRVTLRIEGIRPGTTSSAIHGSLTVGNGVTNFHTVAMTDTGSTGSGATLAIPSGGLTNAAGAILQTIQGSSGGRIINADIVNHGTVDLQHTTQLNKAGGRYENHASWTIGSGDTMTVTSGHMVQASGSLNVTGVFNGSASTFDFNGGVLTGTAVKLLNGALNFGPQSSGAGTFLLHGTVGVSGNINAGQVVVIEGIRPSSTGSATAAVVTTAPGTVNSGTIRLTSDGASAIASTLAIGGVLTNAAAGIIETIAGDGGGRTIAGALVNHGTIEIKTPTSATGTLTNHNTLNVASTGSLSGPSGSTMTQESGVTTNAGGISLSSATFTFNGGTITNDPVLLTNGTLNMGPGSNGAAAFTLRGSASLTGNTAPGQLVIIEGWRPNTTGTALAAVVTLPSDMVNGGTLRMTSGGAAGVHATLRSLNGTLTNAATGLIETLAGASGARNIEGSVLNHGTVQIKTTTHIDGTFANHNAVTIAATETLVADAGTTFSQIAGPLTVSGGMTMVDGAFHFNGGSVTTNTPILTRTQLTFGPGSDGPGAFRLRDASTMSGNIASGQTVMVEGWRPNTTGTATGAHVTVQGAMVNAGVLQLTSAGTAGVDSTVTITGGAFTNALSGVIETIAGSAGARRITGTLVNHGTIHVKTTTTLAGGQTNHGTLNIDGLITLTVPSGSVFTQQAGTINLNGTGVFTMSSGSFNFHGGTIAGGSATLSISTLNFGTVATGTGVVRLTGKTTLTGNIPPGVRVDVEGLRPNVNQSTGAEVTVPAGAINAGTIRLTTSGVGGVGATMNVTGGTLTNAAGGTIEIHQGASGARIITGHLVNHGTVHIALPLTFGVGTFHTVAPGTITGGSTLTLNPGSAFFGTGTVTSHIVNRGQFNAGHSPGALAIIGNFTQLADGAFNAEIGGAAPGAGYDQVNVSQAVNLAGRLNVSLANGFCGTGAFDVITYAARSGDFGTTAGLNQGSIQFATQPGATFYRLNATGTCLTQPLGSPDAYSVNEDAVLTVAAPGVLGNDADPQPGATLTALVATPSAHGSLTLNGDGSFTYTPAENFHGVDGFTYSVSDGSENSLPVAVTLTVLPLNDAPVAADDAYTTAEDVELVVSASAGLLQNDSDIDGPPATVTVVVGPAHGALALQPDGAFTYQPDANFSGGDGFTYHLDDGAGGTATASVTLSIDTVNDAPTALNVDAETNEETAVDVALVAEDVDSEGLVFTLVSGPANGTLAQNGDQVTYTPAPDFFGIDTFTFTANDGALDSNLATVTVTVAAVNDAPSASDVSAVTDEDQAVAIPLAGADGDGDTLAIIIVNGPQHGTLERTGDEVVYVPAVNFSGTDSFTFKVNDGALDSNIAVASIAVAPVNDAPSAADGSATTDEDQPVEIPLPGEDVDSTPLTFTVVDGPLQGLLAISGSTATYTPAANFSGTDSFTFTVSDGQLTGNTATVTIGIAAVNDAPTLSGVRDVTVAAGSPVTLVISGADVEGTVVLEASGLVAGALFDPASGLFSWTPATPGVFTVTFTARDSGGAAVSHAAVITVTGSTNRPPSCAGARPSVTTIWSPNGRWVPVFIKGITDPDGDRVTVRITSITVNEPKAGGDFKVIWNSLALLRAKRSGSRKDGRIYTIHFTATDARGASCSGRVTVTVPHDQGKKHRKDDDGDHDGCDRDRDHHHDDDRRGRDDDDDRGKGGDRDRKDQKGDDRKRR